MSDFIADLETELVDAARRRATRPRRHVRMPRLRPATVLAVVALAALAVALVAAVRGLDDGSRAGDERPSVPPGPGAVFPLPAAEVARACPGVEQRTQAGEATTPRYRLGIFNRAQTETDAVPPLDGADSYSWIPVGTIFPDGSRRPTPEQFDAELYLVPAAEPRQGGACDGQLDAVLGVCLVVRTGETVVKCFSNADVSAGRALALTSPGVVHGIAPSGAARVTLHGGDETVSADVHENVYEIRAPVVAGEEIRLELERLEECDPSREVLDAVPALRDGAWQLLPAPAGEPMPDAGVRQWARRIQTGDEVEAWAIARCDSVQHACVLVVHGGNWVSQPCESPRDLRNGTWEQFAVPGRVGVAGMAPPGREPCST